MNSKIKPYFLFIYIFGFLASSVYAQVTGYQGKRMIISYDLGISPTYTYVNKNFNNQAFVSYNDAHYFSADYIVSKSTTIGMRYGLFKTGAEFENDFQIYLDDNNYGYRHVYYSAKNILISGSDLELRVKHYLKHLAPLGYYFGYFAGTRSVFLPEGKVETIARGNNAGYGLPDKIDVKYSDRHKYLTLGLEFGRERVVFDKFTLKYGCIFRLTNAGDLISNDIYPYHFESSAKRYIAQVIDKRIFSHSLVMFNLGIGYLVF
jgi:hypothetical protein